MPSIFYYYFLYCPQNAILVEKPLFHSLNKLLL